MILLRILAGLALLVSGSGAVLAHSYKLGALEIGHPWARATPPTGWSRCAARRHRRRRSTR